MVNLLRFLKLASIASCMSILAACGGGGGGGASGGGGSSATTVSTISGSIQGTYSNATAVIFDQTGKEITRTPLTTGGNFHGLPAATFSVNVMPGTYKVMLIANDGTANQGIYYCCYFLSPENLFTLSQGATLSLDGLVSLSGGGGGTWPPGGVTGAQTSTETTLDINGTWNVSRTVSATTCPDRPAGTDASIATIVQTSQVVTTPPTPISTNQGSFVTVTTNTGETFKGSTDGSLAYISEYQPVPATNTSSTTYELMTISPDGKSMSGTFNVTEAPSMCLAQGTLTATKQ